MSSISGGLPGNLPRVLPDGLGVRLARPGWRRPPLIELIAEKVAEQELRRVFNLGVGFVFVVAKEDAARATEALASIAEAPIDLGEIVSVPDGTDFEARVIFPEGPPA
jgi:phosphoribosylformylglycinamidine cyclo-ligase